MSKSEVLRIRISEEDKKDSEDAAKKVGESASEFARIAIKNRVKKVKRNRDSKWKMEF